MKDVNPRNEFLPSPYVKQMKKKANPAYEAFASRLSQLIGDEKPYTWARKHGIPKSTMSNVLTRRSVPRGKVLEQLADAGGCSPDWLLGVSEEGAPKNTDYEVVSRALHRWSKRELVEDIIEILDDARGPGDRKLSTAQKKVFAAAAMRLYEDQLLAKDPEEGFRQILRALCDAVFLGEETDE